MGRKSVIDTATTSKTRPRRYPPPRREYTYDEKLRAVVAVLTVAPDKPTGRLAMQAARETGIDVNVSSLREWTIEYKEKALALLPRPTDAEIIEEQHETTLNQWTKIREKYQGILLEKESSEVDARSAVIVAGTAHDKVERASSIPADLLASIESIIRDCLLLQTSAADALKDYAAFIHSQVPTLADVVTARQVAEPGLQIDSKVVVKKED